MGWPRVVETSPGVSMCHRHPDVERHRMPSGDWYCHRCQSMYQSRKSSETRERKRHSEKRWRTENRQRVFENTRRWRAENPQKTYVYTRENNWRRRGILNKHGDAFTIEDFYEMLAGQQGLCALCGEEMLDEVGGRHVDHEHGVNGAGIARGITHGECNINIEKVEWVDGHKDMVNIARGYLARTGVEVTV